jgi:hypothetical protein
MSWETAEWADGPKVAAWLKDHLDKTYPDWKRKCPNLDRAWRRWTSGERASVWSLDNHLTPLGLHVQDIPDDVWLVELKEAA